MIENGKVLRKTQRMMVMFLLLFLPQMNGKEVKVGFGHNKAPFVIEKNGKGLEIDIFREALAYKNHSLKVKHFSNKRLQLVLQTIPDMDAVATVQIDQNDGFFYVADFISFDNYAITKKVDAIQIDKVEDLKGLRIVTWQNAYRDLGNKFHQIFKPEPKLEYKNLYQESVSQRHQNITFWRSSSQVLVIDKTIFLWNKKQLSKVINTDFEVNYHAIFSGKTYFYAGFRDQQIAKDFAEGLAQLKKTGRYEELYQKYTDF